MPEVLALFIPIVAVAGFFAWMIALSPLGRAYAERLRGTARPPAAAERDDAVLRALEDVRREVAELAERVDFTERLLSKVRGAEQLKP